MLYCPVHYSVVECLIYMYIPLYGTDVMNTFNAPIMCLYLDNLMNVFLARFYTVEPLNNGHIGMDHFVPHREVVLFQRLICIATLYSLCIGKCPLYRCVLYSECPLSEVPLYILLSVWFTGPLFSTVSAIFIIQC